MQAAKGIIDKEHGLPVVVGGGHWLAQAGMIDGCVRKHIAVTQVQLFQDREGVELGVILDRGPIAVGVDDADDVAVLIIGVALGDDVAILARRSQTAFLARQLSARDPPQPQADIGRAVIVEALVADKAAGLVGLVDTLGAVEQPGFQVVGIVGVLEQFVVAAT